MEKLIYFLSMYKHGFENVILENDIIRPTDAKGNTNGRKNSSFADSHAYQDHEYARRQT
jgi:hypothetical protein